MTNPETPPPTYEELEAKVWYLEHLIVSLTPKPIEGAPRDGTRILVKLLCDKWAVVRYENKLNYCGWVLYGSSEFLGLVANKMDTMVLEADGETTPTHYLPLSALTALMKG